MKGVKGLTVEQLETIFRNPTRKDTRTLLAQNEPVTARGNIPNKGTGPADEVLDTGERLETVRPAQMTKPSPYALDPDLMAAFDNWVDSGDEESQFLGTKD